MAQAAAAARLRARLHRCIEPADHATATSRVRRQYSSGSCARSCNGTRASCSKPLSRRRGPPAAGRSRSPPRRVRTLRTRRQCLQVQVRARSAPQREHAAGGQRQLALRASPSCSCAGRGRRRCAGMRLPASRRSSWACAAARARRASDDVACASGARLEHGGGDLLQAPRRRGRETRSRANQCAATHCAGARDQRRSTGAARAGSDLRAGQVIGRAERIEQLLRVAQWRALRATVAGAAGQRAREPAAPARAGSCGRAAAARCCRILDPVKAPRRAATHAAAPGRSRATAAPASRARTAALAGMAASPATPAPRSSCSSTVSSWSSAWWAVSSTSSGRRACASAA